MKSLVFDYAHNFLGTLEHEHRPIERSFMITQTCTPRERFIFKFETLNCAYNNKMWTASVLVVSPVAGFHDVPGFKYAAEEFGEQVFPGQSWSTK